MGEIRSQYGSNAAAETPTTEAAAVAAIARDSIQPTVQGIEKIGVPVVILPKTGEAKSLENLLPNPTRARAKVTVRDHQSFVEYVRAHKGPGTVIFAEVTETGGSFVAVLDFHAPGRQYDTDAEATAQAQWGEHVCVYVCEFTPEWKRWRDLSGKALTQIQMALFIEDNLFDIARPEPAAMLEMVKTLEASQGVKFNSLVRLNNGDRKLGYSVETGAKAGEKGDMEIPEKFRLKFAVFTNGPTYDIDCRFRYNINDGALRMAFEIERPHKVIELALAEARQAIVETLKPIPVLLGNGTVGKA